MTIPLSLRKSGPYTATDGQTIFNYGWPLLAADDILVQRIRDGVETTLAYPADFTLTGIGGASGTFVLTAGALADDKYIAVGARKVERLTEFPGWRSIPTNTVDQELNEQTIRDQELRRDIDRALKTNLFDETFFVAGGKRIAGIADAINDDDVPTFAQVKALTAGDDIIDAEAAAATAIAAAAQAVIAASAGMPRVATRTALKSIDTTSYKAAYLTETGREGVFVWRTGNYSAAVTADTAGAIYLAADAVASTVGAWVRAVASPASPRWWGAVGDGVTSDATAYASAEATNDLLTLPAGYTFNIGVSLPAKAVGGPGKLKLDTYTIDNLAVRAFPHRLAAYFNPSNYGNSEYLYNGTPTGGGQGNTVFGSGSFQGGVNVNGESSVNVRNTVFGAVALSAPVQVERCEAIGQGALRWCRVGERNSALGSLSMQWGGGKLDDDPLGKFYWHDLLYNSGTPISNGAWDAFGLETLLPGTRASIVAWLAGTPWASTSADFAYNISHGRDALVEIVRGQGNTAIGYRASGLLLQGDFNSTFGYNALFNGVFVSQNVAIGTNSGFSHVSGNANVYIGRNAGYDNISGANNVIIGNNAGNGSSGTNTGSGNVLIGNSAGVKADGTIVDFSNQFRLQNSATQLLARGDFATGWYGVGVPEAETAKGRLHVFTQAVAITPQTSGDEFVIEGNDAGMSILSANTLTGSIFFGDSGSAIAGYVQYNHNGDYLRFGAGASERMRITTGVVIGSPTGADQGAGTLNTAGALFRNGVQVVSSRATGWAAATGTATRTTFVTSSVTLPNLAERVKALIDDLISHGLIGA